MAGPPSTRSRAIGVGLVLAATVSIQFGAAQAKELIAAVGPALAVTLRVTFGGIITGAAIRPDLRRWTPRQWRAATALGLAMVGMNFSLYSAISRIPLGLAVAVEFVGPMSIAIVHRRRPLDLIWIVAAGTGIVLLTPLTGSGLDPIGLAWAGSAAAFWAAYIVASERAGRVTSGADAIPVALGVASAVALAATAFDGRDTMLDPHLLTIGLIVAVMSSAIPYSLEIEALRRIPAGVFGLLMSVEPLVAALAGFVVLGERITPRDGLAIGCLLVANLGTASGLRAGDEPPIDAP